MSGIVLLFPSQLLLSFALVGAAAVVVFAAAWPVFALDEVTLLLLMFVSWDGDAFGLDAAAGVWDGFPFAEARCEGGTLEFGL